MKPTVWPGCAGVLLAATAGLAQSPPLATSAEWLPWYQNLLAQRMADCPLARPVTYYFSQAGDDTTGDGSIDRPWKTLAKAQAVLDASSGNIALLFRRGDVWREDVGINTSQRYITIADYGSGPKPVLSGFRPIPSAGWSPVPGTVNTYSRADTDAVTWVKEDDDFDFPYGRRASVGTVESHEASFWYDASTQTLYIHPKHGPNGRATDPRTDGKSYESVVNHDSGIIVQGHSSHVENIRAIGWGMTGGPVTQHHGIESRTRATDQALFIGCESFYGNTHAMVHFSDVGGVATFVGCTAGLTTFNTTGNTVFNTYATYGTNQTIWDHCVAAEGTLPGDDHPGREGWAFYGHTGGGPGQYMGLTISYGCTTRAGPVGCASPGTINNLPPAPTLGDVSCFLVNETFEGGPGSGEGFGVGPGGTARIGGRFLSMRPPTLNALALATWAQSGWLINCTVELDLADQTYNFALYNAPPLSPSDVRIWNCSIHAVTHPGVQFAIDWDSPNQSGAVSMVNSVLSITGAGGGFPNVGSTGTVRNNAYYGADPATYANDASPVALAAPIPAGVRPACASGVACAAGPLPGGIVLAWDQSGPVAHRAAIGALEPPPCANCDASTTPPVLNVNDFLCFQFRFASGDSIANCDGSTTPPVLNVNDFLCFMTEFARACP